MDTIVAVATARGRAGIAVIRVSGEQAKAVCRSLCGSVPPVRHAALRVLSDQSGDMLDQALVLFFEAGASFTGEDVCEFHVHGGSAVVEAVLSACLAVPGVRAAEPGEFTRRAFAAGRMTLNEVEALADLIDAETEAQRRLALRTLGGEAQRKIEAWRENLLQALAMIEAALDFADEELPADLTETVLAPLRSLRGDLERELAGRAASERVREGFEVAIIGAVNVGKSSLLNALAGREAAITSSIAGTTRDVIEVRMSIGGLPVTLIDTAGLRDAQDEIERIGIERGRQRARDADLRILLLDGPTGGSGVDDKADIVRVSKCDLWNVPGISARTGEGLDALIDEIQECLAGKAADSSVFSRSRHFDKLDRALGSVVRAISALESRLVPWELVSEELRDCLRSFDGIVGRIDVEDVLGRIFSSFCIGK